MPACTDSIQLPWDPQPHGKVHCSWMNVEQSLAGDSLPYLFFPRSVLSPLCNQAPVQRKAIFSSCELNPDWSCVTVQSEHPRQCCGGGSAVLVCSLTAEHQGWGRGRAALPASCTKGPRGVWHSLRLQLPACQGGKAFYWESTPLSSGDSSLWVSCWWRQFCPSWCTYICESIIHFTCHFFSLLGIFPCHHHDRRVDLRVPPSAKCLAEIQNCWEIHCGYVRSILEGISVPIWDMLYLCCCLTSCFSCVLWLLVKVWGMHILISVLLPKSNRPTGWKIMVYSKILTQQY